MWLTEWNINQDPNRTDSKFANSVLHAALTQQFLNILNTANATYGNFIKHATYHTFATDGGNAMVNKQSGKGANLEASRYRWIRKKNTILRFHEHERRISRVHTSQ
jgi:hypothetical protein